jgi:hypothetical protein
MPFVSWGLNWSGLLGCQEILFFASYSSDSVSLVTEAGGKL